MSDRARDNSSPLGPLSHDELEEQTLMPLDDGLICFTIYWPRRGDPLALDEQADPFLDQARRTGHACHRKYGLLARDWWPFDWRGSST
jgi:hypothetical protein